MPWFPLDPSIQLGIIKTALESAGIEVETFSVYLEFYDLLKKNKLVNPKEYARLSNLMESSEWVFTTPDFGGDDEEGVARILGNDYPILQKIKGIIPDFMEKVAQYVVQRKPTTVGFSITFAQSIASLQLAKRIKELDPKIKILLGGPTLIEGVGEALLKNYPFIDAIYYGDAEGSLVDFLRGSDPNCISTREKPAIEISRVSGDQFLTPNYDEFFSRVDQLDLHEIKLDMKFPFETGRGCWWGFKNASAFCSEDVTLAPYRAKTWQNVVSEVRHQAIKYNIANFFSVDSVLDYKHNKELLQGLADIGFDLEFFFPVKSNIGLEDLKYLKKAGVSLVQPGIESLSTPILRLMDKGVSTIQNIRFLKFSSWLGLKLSWTFLTGFLGEDPEDYVKMARLSKNLQHLYPPLDVVPCLLYRGSKLFRNPEKQGIQICGPLPIYYHLYSLLPAEINNIAFKFQYNYQGLNADYPHYTQPLREVVWEWQRNYRDNKRILMYHLINGRIILMDRRSDRKVKLELNEFETSVYLNIFDITSISRIPGDPAEIERTVASFEEKGLVFRENDQLLALALPAKEPER